MISVVMITKNCASTLRKTLESIKTFPEVILVDTGSEDQTVEIAKTYPNVKIYTHPFSGFGPLKNYAISLTTNQWILSLDGDEELSPICLREIFSLELDENYLYSFPFHNYFNQKWIKGCGWYPDRHIRLFSKKKTQFSNDQVHETILKKELKTFLCQGPIYHYSYQNVADFLRKMQLYTDLFAKQNKGRKSSLFQALSHGMFAFFKSYVLKRGFLDGKEGLIISLYNSQTAYYKYLKLLK